MQTEFFVTPKIVAIKIWRNNTCELRQLSSRQKCVNPQFSLNNLFVSLLTGVTGYFHHISRYIHDLHIIYLIFSMLFVLCTCKAHNLAENQTNLTDIHTFTCKERDLNVAHIMPETVKIRIMEKMIL